MDDTRSNGLIERALGMIAKSSRELSTWTKSRRSSTHLVSLVLQLRNSFLSVGGFTVTCRKY
jgi:hypothetical protein